MEGENCSLLKPRGARLPLPHLRELGVADAEDGGGGGDGMRSRARERGSIGDLPSLEARGRFAIIEDGNMLIETF